MYVCSNHEGLMLGLFPICVLDPLLWLSFVSSWIGCSFFYSLSVIDWFSFLRCLLILYYILKEIIFTGSVKSEERKQLEAISSLFQKHRTCQWQWQ